VKKENNKGILIDQLVLVGHKKDYVIPFVKGVNIIFGDSATGKSSILECINYLFGSSKFVFDEEIEAAVKYVMMQVALGGVTYVIKRDIFDVDAEVEVYASDFDSINKIFPKKYSPNYAQEGRDGYLSDFYLAALGMPLLTVRQAPTKVDSEHVRLSFRDVFKYCYLKQDDVGAKALLGDGSFVGAKARETFKYIFNLLDSAISDLQNQLSVATAEQRKAKDTYDVVSGFLRAVEFKTEFDLDDARVDAENRQSLASDELDRIGKAITENNESYAAFKAVLSTLTLKIKDSEKEIDNADRLVEQYLRLRNDYQSDIDKLNAIKKTKGLIGADQYEKQFSCPLCESQLDLKNVKHSFDISADENVNQDINSITRRMREADRLATRERTRRDQLISELELLNEEQSRARRMLDEEMGSATTPYLAERDTWSFELAKASEELESIERNLKIRNQLKSIFKEVDEIEERILKIQNELRELQNKAPSVSEVVGGIGDILEAYLRKVNISDIRDVQINERSFLPILRNREYRDITSGGLRTILSIGYFLSVLEFSTTRFSNHPKFLMIDTVGKYLGKTDAKYSDTNLAEDRREGTSDPGKYKNIYQAMMDACDRIEKRSEAVQIIVVDNDLPEIIENTYPGSIAAYFRGDGRNGISRGLIDDAHLK